MSAKILLIDDEPDLLELIADFFEMEDFEVLKADTGTKALELLNNHSDIAAVVSDLNLGDMRGSDILSELKTREKYPPFFFSTGSMEYTEEQAKADGATGLFTKPFDMDQLVDTIKKCI